MVYLFTLNLHTDSTVEGSPTLPNTKQLILSDITVNVKNQGEDKQLNSRHISYSSLFNVNSYITNISSSKKCKLNNVSKTNVVVLCHLSYTYKSCLVF